MLAYALLLVFPAAMILAALSDLVSMTIPNRISLALAGTFLILAPIAGLPWEQIGVHLATGFAVLAIGIALFATGTVGGGDVKLFAAGALWVGYPGLAQFFAFTAIFGGALTLLVLLYRFQVPAASLPLPDWAMKLHDRSRGVPYGIAIAAGALVTFPKTHLYALVLT